MDFANKLHFVNLWQSQEERRNKYLTCRLLGASVSHSQRMRDWLTPKIERFFNLPKGKLKEFYGKAEERYEV